MTVPFYSHEELKAAIAKERLWIAAMLHDVADDINGRILDFDNTDEIHEAAVRVAKGEYPRPLVVDPEAG